MSGGTPERANLGAILEQVRQVISEQVRHVSANEVSIGTRFTDDLHLDGLDYIELVMAAEERFRIEISKAIAEKLETVGDLSEYILYRLDPSTPAPSALTRKRRLSSPLECIQGCGQVSVKAIGWTTALALVLCAFSTVGLALMRQLAAPLIVAIGATMLVTIAPVIYDIYVSKRNRTAIIPAKSVQQQRQRRNGIAAAILLAVAMGVSLVVPCPTVTQQRVLQIVMALAAGAFAANLPGFLSVKVGSAIRAGGALAAFVLVLLWNPASWSIRGGPAANAGCQAAPTAFSQSK